MLGSKHTSPIDHVKGAHAEVMSRKAAMRSKRVCCREPNTFVGVPADRAVAGYAAGPRVNRFGPAQQAREFPRHARDPTTRSSLLARHGDCWYTLGSKHPPPADDVKGAHAEAIPRKAGMRSKRVCCRASNTCVGVLTDRPVAGYTAGPRVVRLGPAQQAREFP